MMSQKKSAKQFLKQKYMERSTLGVEIISDFPLRIPEGPRRRSSTLLRRGF
jgi:hypothetical protein